MRNIFIQKLIQEAYKQDNIYLLTGDLGYNAFEPFQKQHPNKFINIGVAENNMVGIASGMALHGKKIFIYSIIPFLVFRSFEQIRNIICHNNLDVKIVGTGGGFSYGNQGISHNTMEDIAIMRSLPNLKIYSPGSKLETELVIDYIFNDDSPSYLRLSKLPENEYLHSIEKYNIGDGLIAKKGGNIYLLTTGNITPDIIKVSKILDSYGYGSTVISFPVIKPLNKKYIFNIINNSKAIITIEEHGFIGGFGSSIAEYFSEYRNPNVLFKRIALNDKVHKEIGNQQYLREINGLGVDDIVKNIVQFIDGETN